MQRCLVNTGRLQVSTEILKACKSPIVKTRLMQKLNLSFNMTQDCLGQLEELKLVECRADTSEYFTTGKGLAFLVKWMQLQEFLKPEEKVSLKMGKISRQIS